jgi:uncharacterized FlgJ-related protein
MDKGWTRDARAQARRKAFFSILSPRVLKIEKEVLWERGIVVAM